MEKYTWIYEDFVYRVHGLKIEDEGVRDVKTDF